MKHLLEAINRGILRGLHENNIELLADLDDDMIGLLDSILVKSMNNKIDCSIKHLLTDAIQTGNISGGLKRTINNPDNFHKYKSIIKANDKNHLKELIWVGLKLFGNMGNFNWIDTSEITDMSDLFYENKMFNGHIELWDVSSVADMSYMFYTADSFNQPISDWDVSNVTNMEWMFCAALKFNLPIGDWDVSNVTNMSRMFYCARTFNSPIGDWDVNNVENMEYMFFSAESFNQPLNNWDVSNVTDMSNMFYKAKSFNLDISNWQITIPYKLYMSDIFSGCPIQNEYKPL